MKEQVYAYLTQIPRGCVVTYGQIAAHLGNPRLCRVVGNILHGNPDGEGYPCYKVVDRDGRVSRYYAFGGAEEQIRRLRADGIEVKDGRVDLKQYRMKENKI